MHLIRIERMLVCRNVPSHRKQQVFKAVRLRRRLFAPCRQTPRREDEEADAAKHEMLIFVAFESRNQCRALVHGSSLDLLKDSNQLITM